MKYRQYALIPANRRIHLPVWVWDDHSEVLINHKYDTGSGPLTGPCAAYWPPLAFGNTRVLVKIRFEIRFKS